VEPYCIAADIYSNPQHPGRGGWTWYTGSASWAYKTGIENILGFRKVGDTVTLDPRVPTDWQTFTIRYRYRSTTYVITYHGPSGKDSAISSFKLVDDGQTHEINI
jgi:cellobiose phosphorylase